MKTGRPRASRVKMMFLAKRGHSPGFIATALGMTPASVRVKLHELGFTYEGLRARSGMGARPAIPMACLDDYQFLVAVKKLPALEAARIAGADMSVT